MNRKAGRGGIGRLIDATHWSLAGLAAAYRGESAFRQELFCAAVMLPLALWLGANAVEKALLVAGVLQVLVVELLNSALEAAVDRVSLEHHELAGRAKDIGSAAVMVSLVLCVAVWLLVLVP